MRLTHKQIPLIHSKIGPQRIAAQQANKLLCTINKAEKSEDAEWFETDDVDQIDRCHYSKSFHRGFESPNHVREDMADDSMDRKSLW